MKTMATNIQKQLTTLFIGAIIGSIATYYLFPSAPESQFSRIIEPVTQDLPEISVAEAQVHREERYAAITTIEETLALPTDFAETEALYAIAGRSDSGAVQNLIYQAARIQDRSDRKGALAILFLRLTELDPRSALAIARSPTFVYDKSIEGSVWVAWGRLNLDAALSAAQEGDSGQKNLAAKSLYASVRDLDNEESRRIQSVLGARPGRTARAQYLYGMVDASPAEAIKYIESLGSLAEQREQFRWLAYRLNQSGRVANSNVAELIQSASNRQMFQQSLLSLGAQSDPETALKTALAQPSDDQSRNRAYAAMRQLASQDPDRALEYLEYFPSQSQRQRLTMSIASGLAQKNPERALAWARENDTSEIPMILMTIVAQIAQTDPQLALAEAQTIQNKQMRDQVIASVISSVAQSDPARAVETIELISDPISRRESISRLAVTWAQMDFDGAIAWVTSLDGNERRRALQQMGQNLVHTDIDRAIRFLNRFPADAGAHLKFQIAQSLARQQTIDAAQSFISQFKGSSDYSRLQVAVISSAASRDPSSAMRMARAVEDGPARDQLYATIVGQQAARDPQQALQWLESISNEKSRVVATSHIARNWYSQNPAAAHTWLRGLPRGAERDSAIVAIVSTQRDSTSDIEQLIESIDNVAQRKQAQLAHIMILARSSPVEAERLLKDIDLSEEERAQYMRIIENSTYGFSF